MEETSPRFGIESPRRRGGRGEERKEGDSRDRWSVEKKGEGRKKGEELACLPRELFPWLAAGIGPRPR